MHDRSPVYTREPDWSGGDRTTLQTEERKVLALLVLYVALILSALWGVNRLERYVEAQQEPVNAAENS
ncbi:MAG: hypothetical protein IT391_03435 [Nitrospira sp.]|nr:hypothetical protein [Nitrospira sp.]